MKVLYNFWGFLTDKIGISDPSGNATYTPWIFQELMKLGHEIYCIIDRDRESVKKYDTDAFRAFSQEKRWKVYKNIRWLNINELIDMDLVILEWRFPTKDNQLPKNSLEYAPDLEIQEKLIEHYKAKGTKIIVFDLDYQFTEEDEKRVMPWKVIETALNPKREHTSVFIPFDFEEINQFKEEIPKISKQLVYIGNPYNRIKDIEEKIIPYANKYPKKVGFWGNWMKDEYAEFREKCKSVNFNGRVGFIEFNDILKSAVCVPLLATEEYKERGFMTMRIIETLLFGSIPLGFSDFCGIGQFLPPELIVDMKNYDKSMEEVMNNLKYMGMFDRHDLRKKVIEKLKKLHRVENFVDVILK